MQMMANALYIRKNLPNVAMPEAIREDVENLCDTWIDTKHDVVGELFELPELFVAPNLDPHAVESKCQLVQGMLAEAVALIEQVTESLQAVHGVNPAYGLAFMLVMESATNVLNSTPSQPPNAAAVTNETLPG